MKDVLAIIPAWERSLDGKSPYVRPFLGRPLIAHSISHALGAAVISHIVVATQDLETAAVANALGVQVVGNRSGSGENLESAILRILEASEHDPDVVVVLDGRAPLRDSSDIDGVLALLERERADSVFSSVLIPGPIWRRGSGPGDNLASEQDADQPAGELLRETGSIYAFKPAILRGTGRFLGGRIAAYYMDQLDALVVRDQREFDLAAELAAHRLRSRPPEGIHRIRLIVFDFDGVMTDNRVLVHQDGSESVACNRGDGLGIGLLKKAGLAMLVLSKETNPVVTARCRKLNLEVIQGCEEKLKTLRQLASERGLTSSEIAYVGNDLNDLECLEWVGLPIGVSDAVPEVLRVARAVTHKPGGHGAVREVADWFLNARRSST